MKKISVIIPTYNESKNIIDLIKEIKSQLKKKNYEIIIVDDNSIDETGKIVKKFFKNDKKIKVLTRKNEKGLASAILFGIKKSIGDIIVGMDADFNHQPAMINQLIKQLDNNDFVVGSRFVKGGGMEDKIRYIFTYIFNLFLKYILDFPTMDNMSGFYAVTCNKLYTLPLKEIYCGYGEYHLRLVWYAKKNSFKIKEIPVYYPNRKYGKSKSNLLKMFFKYIYIAFCLYFKDKIKK